MNIEKEILDNVFIFIKSKPITPNESEDECLRVYKFTPYVYGTLSFLSWGYLAYKTIDFNAFNPNKEQSLKTNTIPTPKEAEKLIRDASRRANLSKLVHKLPAPKRSYPLWLNIMGILAVSAGAFTTMMYTSKIASRTCLQCLLDGEEKKSDLNRAVRRVLKDHHPTAHKFFDAEQNKV